jgi:hypothetical protein
MATTVQKITLSPSRDIPFNKLLLSQSNVRRVKAGVSIEELAEDIVRRGLLQGLSVRAVSDQAGVKTGMFEIPAGGRRDRALELFVKRKRLAKTAPVPCIVRDSGIAEKDCPVGASRFDRFCRSPRRDHRPVRARSGQADRADDGLGEDPIIFNMLVRPVCAECTRRFYFSFLFVRARSIYFPRKHVLR